MSDLYSLFELTQKALATGLVRMIVLSKEQVTELQDFLCTAEGDIASDDTGMHPLRELFRQVIGREAEGTDTDDGSEYTEGQKEKLEEAEK